MMKNLANKSGTPSFLANPGTSRVIFMMSAGAFVFYFVEKFVLVDVYRFALSGAIYEILWLPMLLSLLVVPLACILILLNKHSQKWLALCSMLLIGGAIFILFR